MQTFAHNGGATAFCSDGVCNGGTTLTVPMGDDGVTSTVIENVTHTHIVDPFRSKIVET